MATDNLDYDKILSLQVYSFLSISSILTYI